MIRGRSAEIADPRPHEFYKCGLPPSVSSEGTNCGSLSALSARKPRIRADPRPLKNLTRIADNPQIRGSANLRILLQKLNILYNIDKYHT